jgi:Tol biopolymer transport system component
MYEYTRDRVRRDTYNGQTPTISQTSFNANWPMAMVIDEGYTPPPTAVTSTAVTRVSGAMRLDVMGARWAVEDSLNVFLGTPDTITIRLNSRSGPSIDGSMLTWGSSSPTVATVNDLGMVEAQAPGLTTISAEYYSERRVEVTVRVFPRPMQVEFTPRRDTIPMVWGDQVRLAAAVELETGQVVRGLLPKFEVIDTLILSMARDPENRLIDGQFSALREGMATIVGSLGGRSWRWVFDVRPPDLQIYDLPSLLLPAQLVDARARYTRPDGSVLREALGVVWESSDTSVVDVQLDGIVTRRPGRARLFAAVGTSRDSIDIAVMGDLLMSAERSNESGLFSYSLSQGDFVPLLADEFGGLQPALSPDGSSIAFVAEREGDRGPRVYLMRSDGSDVRRLVPEKSRGFLSLGSYYEDKPAWSRDGTRLYFGSNRDGNNDIYSISADGNEYQLQRVIREGTMDRDVAVSDAGPTIAFERVRNPSDSDIILYQGEGTEEVNITASRARFGGRPGSVRESKPTFVPGSNRILLVEEGFDETGGEALLLFDLGSMAAVTRLVPPRDGSEILYAVSPTGDRVAYQQRPRGQAGDGRVVVIDLEGSPRQVVSLPAGVRLQSLAWGADGLPAN